MGQFYTENISINSFAADFLAPSAGKNIYVREIKLQSLTFVNTAIAVANGTEGVLSTLVANGTGTVSTIVANGSERVKLQLLQQCAKLGYMLKNANTIIYIYCKRKYSDKAEPDKTAHKTAGICKFISSTTKCL